MKPTAEEIAVLRQFAEATIDMPAMGGVMASEKLTAEQVATAVADAKGYVGEFEAAGPAEIAELYASYRVSRALLALARKQGLEEYRDRQLAEARGEVVRLFGQYTTACWDRECLRKRVEELEQQLAKAQNDIRRMTTWANPDAAAAEGKEPSDG
jgi:hypothetical protein